VKRNFFFLFSFLLLILLSAEFAQGLPPENPNQNDQEVRILDTDSYIDANRVLMFVTNKGSIAYDQGATLGKSDGFYYPYLGLPYLQNGTLRNSVIFAGGIWIGGVDIATGDTLISVAEYSDDFYPGPMINGTYIPNANTLPQYRVFKLYADSQLLNPNQDYLNWPDGQGAPVDENGNPKLLGDQTLWSVFNDAYPNSHINDASSNIGMGIEVQHTAWASHQDGNDTIPYSSQLPVSQIGSTTTRVQVFIIDPLSLTGDSYSILIDNHATLGPVWHLKNNITGDIVIHNQSSLSNDNEIVTDGFLVRVTSGFFGFDSIQVVSNAAGPIDPPAGGAFDFQGFPSIAPDSNQQVGPGMWAFHVRDNGGSSGGGNIDTYQDFLGVLGAVNPRINPYDFEMRFTGSISNPGVNGSLADNIFGSSLIWVPFELWRIGIGTPDDPSDDIRMTPQIWDFNFNDVFDLGNWGTPWNGGGLYEHSASPNDDDPYTDNVTWYMPRDTSFGESGYHTDIEDLQNGLFIFGAFSLRRTVLINWNGGTGPLFNQDMPEQGTVFRLISSKEIPADTFTFSTFVPPSLTTGTEGVSIYSKYKLINKGNKSLSNFFISLWFDPDVGSAGDDFVGCDTLNDIFFSYNDGLDEVYGLPAPAVGGKLLEGPIVPSVGNTAYVDGQPIPDHKNVRMFSFMKIINGTDSQSPTWTYQYMNGLDASQGGVPLANGTRYAVPGDPVLGIGDLDFNSSDRRMMATFGPIDFAPNDTQQILFKLAVGQGHDQLSSITELKNILNFVPGSAAEPVSYIKPTPQRAVFLRTIEPFYDTIFIGWQDGSSVLNIDGPSLVVNDTITPESAILQLSHPGHNGPVWKLTVDARRFLLPYGHIYDTVLKTYSIDGELTDETPFSIEKTFIYIGHRRGDINRNGAIDIADLNFIVNRIFRGGPLPEPIASGDLNEDGIVSVIDLATMVALIFR
jgi:hypothetical protein